MHLLLQIDSCFALLRSAFRVILCGNSLLNFVLAQSQEQYLKHLSTIKDLVQGSTGVSAAIYTQLTDVDTEPNGIMSYDRKVSHLSTPYQSRQLRKAFECTVFFIPE